MNYRAEVDGLRAVAVVPVILFHAGVPGITGGFVGVDVFFVISGFLITTLILRAQDREDFSLLTFYERRARRILPALFLVLAATVLAAYNWIPFWDFPDFLRSVAATALFLSNVHFWENIGYFAVAAEEQPLLHTWSLAVEEQFYLLFPLLLMVKMRPAILGGVVLGMFVASLALSQWGSLHEPEVNFFFTPSRVWELMAGALCAIWKVSRTPKPNDALAFIGLAMVVSAMFIYDTSTPFPSFYTLLPVVGACLLLSAHPGTYVQKVLSCAPLVGIGLISYSAYLWHQPLFVFARLKIGPDLTLLQIAILILATIALSYVTWRWVEQPVRKAEYRWSRTRGQVFALSGAGIAASIIAFATLDNEEHYLAGLTPKQIEYLPYLRHEAELREASDADTNRCSVSGGLANFDVERCLELSDTKANVLLIGDSHASHFFDALVAEYPEVNMMQATASGCRPLLNYAGDRECTDLARFLLETYIPDSDIDAVIVSGRWRSRDVQAARTTAAHLRPHVANVIVMGPTIEYTIDLPQILMKHADADLATIIDVATSLRRMDRTEVSQMMAEATVAAGAKYVDVQAFLCAQDRCRVFTPDGVPITYDNGHFLPEAATWIIREMRSTGALRLEDIGG
ncbi:acyltransferase family protein [Loktanella sp. Alg231-35]|uniref:acyltransferase family protein n=1 Tax=Loktanella sp. Alg231-35 TaxID=1922220 RepID=UPI000D55E02E|nr:acyltransferase family protein [Loktanella sp. Alg231-35]